MTLTNREYTQALENAEKLKHAEENARGSWTANVTYENGAVVRVKFGRPRLKKARQAVGRWLEQIGLELRQ